MYYISKFSSKVFLMILILVIVPFALVNNFCRIRMEDFFQQELSDNVFQNVSKNQSFINDSLSEIAYYSNVFVYDEELRNRISSNEHSVFENTVYFDYIINRNAIENSDSLRNKAKVMLLDQYGNIYSNWSLNYKDYRFILEEEWVKKSIEAEGHIVWSLFSPSYVMGEENQRYISLARSVLRNGTDGEPIATLIISISQDVFSNLMMQYAFEDDEAYICIREGEVLLADKERSISDADLKQIYKETESHKNGKIKKQIEGKEYLICYSTFPHPWLFDGQEMKLFHFTDYHPIQEKMDEVMSGINMVTFISLGVVVMITFLASRKIVAPIVTLTEQMENYTPQGEIENLNLQRSDEIGRLNLEFARMGERIQHLFNRLKEENEIKEKYHYESLRAQLNPHFLFNTLSTIRWMAVIRSADNIVDSIDAIGGILKYSMGREEGLVTVREELDNIRDYIYIHNLRYAEYIKLEVDVEEAYLDYKTLKFILQPIVENAIIHGFDKSKPSLHINVSALRREGTFYLYVRDDGTGIGDSIIEEFQTKKEERSKKGKLTGIGLNNVDAYIKIRLGQAYGIRLKRRDEGGTEVRFRLPVLEGEQYEAGNDSR